jgi:carboxyl-terminal processing protease
VVFVWPGFLALSPTFIFSVEVFLMFGMNDPGLGGAWQFLLSYFRRGVKLTFIALAIFTVGFAFFVYVVPYQFSPEGLYRVTWLTARELAYDQSKFSDWQKWEHRYDGQIDTDDKAVEYANVMLASLGDQYTSLLSSQEVESEAEQASGHFVGIGVQFRGEPAVADAQGKLQPVVPEHNLVGFPLINAVLDDGPAQKAGLLAGDALVTVDAHSVQGLNLEALVKVIRGVEGSTVLLEVEHQGQIKLVALVRSQVLTHAVKWKVLEAGGEQIGYLKILNFSQNSLLQETADALKNLAGVSKLVLDLRDNPGGRVDYCVQMVGFFMKEGVVVRISNRLPGAAYLDTTYRLVGDELVLTIVDQANATSHETAASRTVPLAADKSLVILVNGGTASAAEMFTGALKDNQRAVVVGEKTYGKGIGQSVVPMPRGTRLHVTSLRYYTPSGAWLGDGHNTEARYGIEPHWPIAESEAISEEDKVLSFGLSHFANQTAQLP